MPTIYNADEAFEMGEQIERAGQRFYQKAAANTDDETVKNLLNNLAEMEQDHEQLFHNLHVKMQGPDMPQISFDPDHQSSKYLRACAKTHVFNIHQDLAETLSGGESEEEVLRMAINFEKDTVVFFLGLKDLVPEDLGRDKIDWLVQEEMSHITTLTEKLHTLAS